MALVEETAVIERDSCGVRPPEETMKPEPVTALTRPMELVARVVKVWTPFAVPIESKGPEVAKVWVEEVEPFKEVRAVVKGVTPFEMAVMRPYESTVVEA